MKVEWKITGKESRGRGKDGREREEEVEIWVRKEKFGQKKRKGRTREKFWKNLSENDGEMDG